MAPMRWRRKFCVCRREPSVTFTNPAGNTKPHCVTQFYEGLFSSGPIQPGQSFSFTFKTPGEYFYNDCADPRTTGKVIVY